MGKKKLMFDIELAKFPPPIPLRNAKTWNHQSGVLGSCRANPVSAAGIIKSAVVKKIVFRPPAIRMKKVEGMRRVAPVNPAIAASVKSSDFSNGKPRFNICTVMMPQ